MVSQANLLSPTVTTGILTQAIESHIYCFVEKVGCYLEERDLNSTEYFSYFGGGR
jgi:hypothetical protein